MAHFGTDLPGNGWAGHNSSTIEEVAVGDLIIDPGVSWKQKVEDVERALPFVKRYARDHVVPVMIDGDNRIIEGTAITERRRKPGLSVLALSGRSSPMLPSVSCFRLPAPRSCRQASGMATRSRRLSSSSRSRSRISPTTIEQMAAGGYENSTAALVARYCFSHDSRAFAEA